MQTDNKPTKQKNIEFAADVVADAVFYSVFDSSHRERLATALKMFAAILVDADNKRQELSDYANYVEGKLDIDEMPMSFTQWQIAAEDLKKYDTP